MNYLGTLGGMAQEPQPEDIMAEQDPFTGGALPPELLALLQQGQLPPDEQGGLPQDMLAVDPMGGNVTEADINMLAKLLGIQNTPTGPLEGAYDPIMVQRADLSQFLGGM